MSKRPSGALNAHKKKLLKDCFQFKLVRVTPDFDVEDLTAGEMSAFERQHPTIAARWINGEDAPATWQQQCQAILKGTMAGKVAAPFNTPVDPVALNLPDYFQVVKKPMDLGAPPPADARLQARPTRASPLTPRHPIPPQAR